MAIPTLKVWLGRLWVIDYVKILMKLKRLCMLLNNFVEEKIILK